MPVLTWWGKRQLPEDFEEDADGQGDDMQVGILAQQAQRREAARELELAQAQEEEQTGIQVHSLMFFSL